MDCLYLQEKKKKMLISELFRQCMEIVMVHTVLNELTNPVHNKS